MDWLVVMAMACAVAWVAGKWVVGLIRELRK